MDSMNLTKYSVRRLCREQITDSISLGRCHCHFLYFLTLLFVNTFLMLLLEFTGKLFLPRTTASPLRWYNDNSITIQLSLLALMAALVIVFRKRIRWDGQK
jgi:hypothetical protein